MLRIPPRRKSIRRLRRQHIYLRHRQPLLRRQPLHRRISSRQLLPRHWLRVVHLQRNLVGEEVSPKVERNRDQKRQHHPVPSTEVIPNQDQQQRQPHQQQSRFERIHCSTSRNHHAIGPTAL